MLCIVQIRYNYRVSPTPGQRDALARAFGCARVVFNDGLRARQEAFTAGLPYLTDGVLSARLTTAKKTPERAWLSEVSSVVLQQALADLNTAYRNFFASVNGKRRGPRMAPPRFRSRKDGRQARRAAGTGTRPGSRSPGRTPGWPTRGASFTTSFPRR
jgi:putative transposase